MPGLPNKELLRVDEVANYFSVTARTVRLWAEHGKLEAIRTPGRLIRITRKSAENCRLAYGWGAEGGPAED